MKKMIIALSCIAVFSCASTAKVEELREPAQIPNTGTFKTTSLSLNLKGIVLASARYKDNFANPAKVTYVEVVEEIVQEANRIEADYMVLESALYSPEIITNQTQFDQISASKAKKLVALNQRSLAFLKNAKQCLNGRVSVPSSFQIYEFWAANLKETNQSSTQTPFNSELEKTPGLRAEVVYVSRVIQGLL